MLSLKCAKAQRPDAACWGFFVDYDLIFWDFKNICDKDHVIYVHTFVYIHIRLFSLPILVYFQYNILQSDNIFNTFLYVVFRSAAYK